MFAMFCVMVFVLAGLATVGAMAHAFAVGARDIAMLRGQVATVQAERQVAWSLVAGEVALSGVRGSGRPASVPCEPAHLPLAA
jgi:hypothetical protein